MVNVNKLRAKIVEKGLNVERLADLSGINKATIYRRLNSPVYLRQQRLASSRILAPEMRNFGATFGATPTRKKRLVQHRCNTKTATKGNKIKIAESP